MEQSKIYTAVLMEAEYPPTPETELAIRKEAEAALGGRDLVIEREGDWVFSGPEEDDDDEEEGFYVKAFHGKPKG
ncbi:MAG: hypothetical protein GEU75_14440 [Dehalococcoidia bacterium]|nr:hypothetical protein [Dehalococcoidia bacterium]